MCGMTSHKPFTPSDIASIIKADIDLAPDFLGWAVDPDATLSLSVENPNPKSIAQEFLDEQLYGGFSLSEVILAELKEAVLKEMTEKAKMYWYGAGEHTPDRKIQHLCPGSSQVVTCPEDGCTRTVYSYVTEYEPVKVNPFLPASPDDLSVAPMKAVQRRVEQKTPNKLAITNMVMHLNDQHKWSREEIADWLDSLDDIDLTVNIETS